jgi:hypothetical protein
VKKVGVKGVTLHYN